MIELRNMKTIAAGEEALLLDVGDGICCLVFRSKGNSITPNIKAFILNLLDQDLLGFDGMVIGSQSKHFSAGADLNSILEKIKKGQFDLFDKSVSLFQQMNLRMKYYHKPIVAAPYGMTLGGGLEIALHAHKRVATETVHMGLVEVGVGLLPSGGGTKETALCMDGLTSEENSKEILTIYDRLLLGTVSKDAAQAHQAGYLNDTDQIITNMADLIDVAKDQCISLLQGCHTQGPQKSTVLQGAAAYKLMTAHAESLLEAGDIAPHDLYIGKHIALILSGSSDSRPQSYSEQHILDAERACFIDLLKHPNTRERIECFLTTNKKLRN